MLKWKFPLRHQDSADGKFQREGPNHYVEISKKFAWLAQRSIRGYKQVQNSGKWGRILWGRFLRNILIPTLPKVGEVEWVSLHLIPGEKGFKGNMWRAWYVSPRVWGLLFDICLGNQMWGGTKAASSGRVEGSVGESYWSPSSHMVVVRVGVG